MKEMFVSKNVMVVIIIQEGNYEWFMENKIALLSNRFE